MFSPSSSSHSSRGVGNQTRYRRSGAFLRYQCTAFLVDQYRTQVTGRMIVELPASCGRSRNWRPLPVAAFYIRCLAGVGRPSIGRRKHGQIVNGVNLSLRWWIPIFRITGISRLTKPSSIFSVDSQMFVIRISPESSKQTACINQLSIGSIFHPTFCRGFSHISLVDPFPVKIVIII